MTLNDVQRAALVLFAAREAGPDANLEQMKAICYVIRNRVRAGWGDGNWLTVIEDHASMAANERLEDRIRIEDRRLQALARDIDQIFFGTEDDEISKVCARQDKERGPIMHWNFIQRPIRKWFEETICHDSANHPSRAQIAMMMLYQ
jgi:hypothetical protein